MKFERITPEKRQEIKKEATAVQTFGKERIRWESTTASQRKTPSTNSERKEHVAPTTEPRERVQAEKERKTVIVPPVAVQRETVQPARERKSLVTPPVVQRQATIETPRESRAQQPERVQIPKSPIVGESGRSGIVLQRGPPSQPKAEVKDKEGRDLKRGWGNSR